MTYKKIVACVDQSKYSKYAVDYASWVAMTHCNPVQLLHIKDDQYNNDEQILDNYYKQTLRLGLPASKVSTHNESGVILNKIIEYSHHTNLLVMGRQGTCDKTNIIGHNTTKVIRSIQTPILTVAAPFTQPKTCMIAFSGSDTSKQLINNLAYNKFFLSLPLHLVMSGKRNDSRAEQLKWAHQKLTTTGYDVTSSFIIGGSNIEDTIIRTVQEQCIDILIMGAFGHTPLYSMIFGSKTIDLLKFLNIPILHLPSLAQS